MSAHLPIILHPLKLQAVLHHKARQVRYVLTPQPAPHLDCYYPPGPYRKGFEFYQMATKDVTPEIRKYPEIHCPYGRTGDLLYVQEEWKAYGPCSQDYLLKRTATLQQRRKGHWQPPETMPKVAARVWLKVAGVTIDRLHPISYDDALAEGPTPCPDNNIRGFKPAFVDQMGNGSSFCLGATVAYKQYCKRVYGKRQWDLCPWVWVVSFTAVSSPLS